MIERAAQLQAPVRQGAAILILLLVACSARAETIVLKSGATVEGTIARTVGSNVTIRTASGFATYHVEELDQDWVDQHYDQIYTRVRRRQTDALKGLAALVKGLFEQDSLARATPFLTDYRKYVVPVSAGLALVGLTLCFLGWRIFKFFTILGGIISGVATGGILAAIVAHAAGTVLPQDVAPWATIALFLLIGIPLVVLGARLGRRFAMFGARIDAMNGLGAGWGGSILALTRFAFFDLSVIWGHALFGAALIVVGAYSAAVPLLAVPDKQLQLTLLASGVAGMLMCIAGAVTQISSLRSKRKSGAFDRTIDHPQRQP